MQANLPWCHGRARFILIPGVLVEPGHLQDKKAGWDMVILVGRLLILHTYRFMEDEADKSNTIMRISVNNSHCSPVFAKSEQAPFHWSGDNLGPDPWPLIHTLNYSKSVFCWHTIQARKILDPPSINNQYLSHVFIKSHRLETMCMALHLFQRQCILHLLLNDILCNPEFFWHEHKDTMVLKCWSRHTL